MVLFILSEIKGLKDQEKTEETENFRPYGVSRFIN